jgi:hypothetical protein
VYFDCDNVNEIIVREISKSIELADEISPAETPSQLSPRSRSMQV